MDVAEPVDAWWRRRQWSRGEAVPYAVGQFRADRFQKLFQVEARPTRLAAAANGGVWICAGTHLYKSGTAGGLQDLGSFQTNRSKTDVTVMLEDCQGVVWLGTAYNGLYRHDDAGFASVPTTHQGILSLHEDKEEISGWELPAAV